MCAYDADMFCRKALKVSDLLLCEEMKKNKMYKMSKCYGVKIRCKLLFKASS